MAKPPLIDDVMISELPTTLAGAFLSGLLASVHCAAMCGPLACAACRVRGGCSSQSPAVWYQTGRLLSYTVVGALAGAFGATLLTLRGGPWVIWAGGALVLLCIVLLARTGNRAFTGRFGRQQGPLIIGLLTAGLPCAALYLMFAVCAISGSPVRGAALALAFALGTVPLLYVAQHQWGRLQTFALHRPIGRFLHASLLFVTVGLVLWRLQAGALQSGICCSIIPFR